MSKSLPLAVLLLAALTLTQLGDVGAQSADAGPIPVSDGDAQWGNADAPVTLVMFSDLQCPFCGRAWTTMGELREKYAPGDLRLVFKHFPLAFHKQAADAAILGALIQAQYGDGKVAEYFSAIHKTKLTSKEDLRAVLTSIGASTALMSKLDDPAAKQQVEADVALGKQIGVTGTPAFYVNGFKLSGARPAADFEKAIDAELSEAKRLRARGMTRAAVSLERTKLNFEKPAPGAAKADADDAPAKPDTTTVWNVPVGKSPVDGRNDALVTLVVFSDFQCPYCSKLAPTLQELRSKYGNDVRVVFKHNPLPFHERAMPAAQLAMEAYLRKGNKGFWEAHDKLFANQKALDDTDLERYARALGLSPTLTMAAVQRSAHAELITEDVSLAEDLDVRGTPLTFINGRKLSGSQPVEAFVAIVDEEIAHAKRLLDSGVARGSLYAEIIKKGKTAPPPETVKIPAPSAKTPVRGGGRARVTVTMFVDFECPFCARVQEPLRKLRDHYGEKVRFAYRHHPLAHHQNAMRAHLAAAEAFRQGGNEAFWKMHDKIYDDPSSLDADTLASYATEIGLDTAQLKSAIDSERNKELIEADAKIAESAGLSGTPAFVINGYKVSGAQTFERFKKVIDRALADSK